MERKMNLFFIFLFFFTSTFANIRLYIFTSPDCPHCQIIQLENINQLSKKLGCKIETKYFNIKEIENYQKLIDLEEKYKDTDNELPVVFIGKYVLGGEEEIKNNLEKLIKEYAKKGGTNWPDEISIQKTQLSQKVIPKEKIYIRFFYDLRCKECERIFYLLNYLEKRYPDIIIKKFNLQERGNKIIFEAIGEKIKIPEIKRLIPATLIIGTDYLQGKDINLKKIETLIKKYKKTIPICIWNLKKEEIEKAEKNIISRFRSFNIFTVILAGLIDGINPCAFAVLVFFVSYLTVIKKRKKDILLVGFSFMFAVFLIYFLIGYGAFSFLSQFTSYRIFSKVMNILVGSGAIITGIFSFWDFLKAIKGKTKEIKLQLPKPIKTKIHSAIINKMNLTNYIFGAFLSGIIISFFEFSCTGQVYLPTIVFVINNTPLKTAGLFYLFLYNLMFLIPLFIFLLLTLIGITSKKIAQFSSKNLPLSKLLLSLFFITLGIYLIIR
jgi:cytochrome c biogenesis protein CcdA